MNKKILIIFLIILISVFPNVNLCAKDSEKPPRVTDDSDLLSEYEEKVLEDKLDIISEKYDCDVIVIVVNSIGNTDPNKYANDFFVDNGFGMGETKSGISLLINLEGRDWAVTAHSKTADKGAQKIFTYYKTDAIGNAIITDLSAGDFYYAFDKFADLSWYYLQEDKNDFGFIKRIITLFFKTSFY